MLAPGRRAPHAHHRRRRPADRPAAAPRARRARPVERAGDHRRRRRVAARARAEAGERFGAAYSIRYSSTESGGVGTGTAFDAPDDEALHTVGRPRPGVEIRSPTRRPVPVATGHGRRAVLRSDAAMAGYWHDPEATADALRDGGCTPATSRSSTSDGLPDVWPVGARRCSSGAATTSTRSRSRRCWRRTRGARRRDRPPPSTTSWARSASRSWCPSTRPAADARRPPRPRRRDLARHKLPEALEVVDELPLTACRRSTDVRR